MRQRATALLAAVLVALAGFSAPATAAGGLPADPALPAHLWTGFYVPRAPGYLPALAGVEALSGVRPATFVNYFQHSGQAFSPEDASAAVAHGSVPLVTLELMVFGKGVAQPAWSLASITHGDHDAYLRSWARAAASFGRVLWVRPLHEMNGNWYPWGGTANGNRPADFVPAWRHIHDIFVQEGAANVRFVWCPNVESIPLPATRPDNAISRYWPGDAYVDYVALDGYNFGYGPRIVWRSFSSLFAAPYAEVTALTSKPLFVAETGCATTPGDKAAWIADMFRVVPARFPRIRGVGWFNGTGERDWRFDSGAASLAAFRAGERTEPWSGRCETRITLLVRRYAPVTSGRVSVVGVLGGAPCGSRVELAWRRAGSSTWTTATPVACALDGGWRARVLLRLAGDYRFRAAYRGAASAWPALSREVAVSVR